MNDEIANLTRFLDRHRAVFRHQAGGLGAEELARTLPPSDLTLGGMVKHLAFVEDWWMGRHLLDDQDPYWAAVDWSADEDWDWHSAAADTPAELWVRWETTVERSRAAVEADPRPERLALRPRGDGFELELRWLLAHLLEEYAQHNGHADLIRQSIDGQVGEP